MSISNAIYASASLIDAVRILESSSKSLAVVVNQEQRVVGTLTDGDIRRSILKGNELSISVDDVMNKNPVLGRIEDSDIVLRRLLTENRIRSIPLINDRGEYVRTLYETELFFEENDVSVERTFGAAVIMAGGEGMRLRPITEKLPKPMVDIDGIPLIERQVRHLEKVGVETVYISINYLGEMIKEYFGDGVDYNVNIKYLEEKEKLGTAGSLSLLPQMDDHDDILVMNGDILTTSDFVHLYHFHKEHESKLTISAIDYHVNIPYGVIDCDGALVTALREKPSKRFFCNAGIYAVSSDLVRNLVPATFFDMTELVERCLDDKELVSVFPVHEYWADIGTPLDLEMARKKISGDDNT